MVDELAARFRRIEDLGLTVPAQGTIPIREGEAEIVKTYADCSVTAVFFRKPPRTLGFPQILEPMEIAGGSGRQVGDLSVMEHGSVEPSRTRIVIGSDRSSPWADEGPRLSLPVDRSRTARYDRFLSGPTPEVEKDGVRARVLGLNAGLLRTAVDLHIEAVDASILALQLTAHTLHHHLARGPGPTELWKEWHPPPSRAERKSVRREGNRTVVSLTSSLRLTARQLSPAEMKKLPPRREPPPEWRATAHPGARALAVHGAHGGGGLPSDRAGFDTTLYFDPPETTESIELSLDRLWASRYDYAAATVPAPHPTSTVDLNGTTIEGQSCRLALSHWDPTADGFTLHATCDPADAWPDVRIVAHEASTSLWASPPQDGEFRGALPLSYSGLFEEETVQLALRLVSRTIEPISFRLPLTKPEAPPAR